MYTEGITDAQLLAWAGEQLPAAAMTLVEDQLRASAELQQRLAALLQDDHIQQHSVAAIWRKHRLSCPTRGELGGLLLGALETAHAGWIRFHVDTIGCRYCAANLEDLQRSIRPEPERQSRRRKYFQSSAGHLDESPRG